MNPSTTLDLGLLRIPARGKSIADEIASQLRSRILSGQIAPGTRLVELEIAGQTGSSQSSVREALQRLENDALVVRRGRMGTFVTEVAPDEMHEIFQVRSTVESAAIRRTAERIQDDQIQELHLLVGRMREAAEARDLAALVELDMRFHQKICAWAEHPTLLRVWMLLHAQLERFLILFNPFQFPDLSLVAGNHLPLIEALAARDPELAAERIEKHVSIPRSTTELALTGVKREDRPEPASPASGRAPS